MADLISRAAALDAISTEGGCGMCARRVLDIPAVDAVPVVSAHYVEGSIGEWYCSNCKRIDEKYSVARYCWYCGAKMLEDQNLAFADQSGAEYADNPTV